MNIGGPDYQDYERKRWRREFRDWLRADLRAVLEEIQRMTERDWLDRWADDGGREVEQ